MLQIKKNCSYIINQLKPYSISGVNQDVAGNIECVGEGDMILRTDGNCTMLIRTLHSPNSSGTIVTVFV